MTGEIVYANACLLLLNIPAHIKKIMDHNLFTIVFHNQNRCYITDFLILNSELFRESKIKFKYKETKIPNMKKLKF